MALHLLRRLYHFSLYFVGFIVLIWAITVSLVRLALPGIDKYQEDIEDWIASSMGIPVQIEKLDAIWEGWTPYISLHQIEIFDQSHTSTIADFKSAHVTIDIVNSLLNMQFIPANINITGLELTLSFNQDGSISITENIEGHPGIQTAETNIAAWLINQRDLSITDSVVNIIYHDKSTKRPLKLENLSLSLLSNSYRTQLDGSADLPDWLGSHVAFKLDIKGNILTSEWYGESYIEGHEILPHVWFAKKDQVFANVKSAKGQVKAWSIWKNAKIRETIGQIAITDLTSALDSTYAIQSLKSNFKIEHRTDMGIDVRLKINEFVSTHGKWPSTFINYSKTSKNDDLDYEYIINSGYLKIEDYHQIVRLFPEIFGQTNIFQDALIEGELHNTSLTYNPRLPLFEQLWINTHISDLGYRDHKAETHISGLSGKLNGNLYQGHLDLDTRELYINVPSQFDYPHAFYNIEGGISWFKGYDAWEINTELLKGHTRNFNAVLSGEIKIPPQVSDSFADLRLTLTEINIDQVAEYLPKSMNHSARAWLKQALVSGKVMSTNMILRGRLADFPFENHEGQFKAITRVQKASLDYHSAWTPVDSIEAEIIFNGNEIRVVANTGKIYDANITYATAVIDNLFDKNRAVKIKGKINGHTRDATLLILQSPLVSNQFLKGIINYVDGLLSLELDMTIPLGEDDDIKVEGLLSLFDAKYTSGQLGITLNEINGTVNFTNNKFNSSDITAKYFDNDVKLKLEKKKNERPNIILKGYADNRFIFSQLEHFYPALSKNIDHLLPKIHGQTGWQAKLTLHEEDAGLDKSTLYLSSSLNGLSLDLPEPLGKDASSRLFELTTTIDNNKTRKLKFDYGDVLVGNLEIDQVSKDLRDIQLVFGPELTHTYNQPGYQISGSIDHLNLTDWLGLMDKIEVNINNEITRNIAVSINSNTAEFFGQTFNNLSLNLINHEDWSVLIDSAETRGEIHIPKNQPLSHVKVALDKYIMKKYEDDEYEKDEFNVDKIPSMDINIKEFQYDEIKLGALTANTIKTEEGLKIENFKFNKPDMEISGHGMWNVRNGQDHSSFTINIHAPRLKNMLETFQYDVAAIEDAETIILIDAQWQGSPMEFSFAGLNGNIDMQIDKGQFLDINPTAGRIFGLLSIQMLPRRLSLDFTDLFNKGLPFDQIQGKFNIESGDAYTNNMILTGPVTNIAVSGRTGLANRDYDQVVTVIPQVADSLPVASALFGPVGLGVGAVIFLAGELFESIPEQIDKLLRYQYTVTGSWDDPTIERFTKRQTNKTSQVMDG